MITFKTTYPLCTALLLTACGPSFVTDSGDDDPVTDPGLSDDATDDATDEPDVPDDLPDENVDESLWAEIGCDGTAAALCEGRPVGSFDAWVTVIPECALAAWEAEGLFVLVDGRSDGCSLGSVGATWLPDTRCYWMPQQLRTACFAGVDDWWVEIKPFCELPAQLYPGWLATACADATEPGEALATPWDNIVCSLGECWGVSGGEAMRVRPSCAFEAVIDQAPCSN